MVGSGNQPDCARRCQDFSRSKWGIALYVFIAIIILTIIVIVAWYVIAAIAIGNAIGGAIRDIFDVLFTPTTESNEEINLEIV